MSHYAKVLDGKVIQVIVADADFFKTFVDTSPGTWLQTSYNTYANQHPEGRPLRGNYAGIGFTYDAKNDVFYAPQPFPSWLLNETTWTWESPTPYPTDNKMYSWDEVNQVWVESTSMQTA
jgi:hypothetical protein